MKPTAGLVFMIGVLLVGVAARVGSQVWAFTGSAVMTYGAGALSLALLFVAVRSLSRRLMIGRNVRFLGELKSFDKGDFVDAVTLDEETGRSRIEDKAQQTPEQVAGSIRSLLAQSKKRNKQQ